MLMKHDIIVFYKQSKKNFWLTLTVKRNPMQIKALISFNSIQNFLNLLKPIQTQLQSRLFS